MADSAIRRYESDRGNPTLDTLKRIAQALNVHVFKLLESTEYADKQLLDELDNSLIKMVQNGYSSPSNFYNDLLSGKIHVYICPDETEKRLIDAYNRLNKTGKEEAAKSVEALTQIYIFQEETGAYYYYYPEESEKQDE